MRRIRNTALAILMTAALLPFAACVPGLPWTSGGGGTAAPKDASVEATPADAEQTPPSAEAPEDEQPSPGAEDVPKTPQQPKKIAVPEPPATATLVRQLRDYAVIESKKMYEPGDLAIVVKDMAPSGADWYAVALITPNVPESDRVWPAGPVFTRLSSGSGTWEVLQGDGMDSKASTYPDLPSEVAARFESLGF
jgi:hypothetical protein